MCDNKIEMIVGWFQGYKQKTKHPTGERLEKRKKKMKETEAQAKLSLKLQAYQYLKTKILNCEYRPNEFLNEQKLCAEMGNISRTPMRDALGRLEQEGLITILPKSANSTNIISNVIHYTVSCYYFICLGSTTNHGFSKFSLL